MTVALGVPVTVGVSVIVGVIVELEAGVGVLVPDDDDDGDGDGDAVAQVTDWGRSVTPTVPQKVRAKSTACFWASASQTPARQHAMPLMKESLAQMHLASSRAQSPIWLPVVYSARQFLCEGGWVRLAGKPMVGNEKRNHCKGLGRTAHSGRAPRSYFEHWVSIAVMVK